VEFGKFSRGDRDDRGGNDRPRYGGDRDRYGRNDRGGDRGGDRNNDRGGDRGGDRNNDRGGRGGDFGGRSRYERNDRGGDRGDRGGFDRDSDESVFSKKVRAGKRRTYFLDVRKTRGEDYFITITESTRREDGFGYKRHKIFLYKEDFNRFVASLNEVVDHVKKDLMPNFDYEEFDRRQAEWEAQNRVDDDDDDHQDAGNDDFSEDDDAAKADRKKEKTEDDDVSW
jgi:Protein of unknown function (DUF3276)